MSENRELISPYVYPGVKRHLVDKIKYHFLFKPENSLLTKDEILEIVSVNTGVSVNDIVGHCRDGEMVMARYITFAMLRYKLDTSLVDIAKYLGRDHTTIIHGLQSFVNRYKQEERYQVISNKVASVVGINIDEKIEKEKLKKNGKRKHRR
jgi:chromosomal replication initiation ATPase DnaA